MNVPASQSLDVPASDFEVVGTLYHRFLTGLMLALASRAGATRGAEVVFRAFRRQQLEKFLPGLDKLGLRHLPPAVACAQYHYLSNALGGAKVEWIPETDRKAWVRYLPPRWIFDGTAVCGIPTEMSRAMLWGWHANNGVLLGNLRLGFVCTSLTTDGGAGAVGYYIEGDHDLPAHQRLRFAPGERPPATPSPSAGASDARSPMTTWEPTRLAKVKRNYSMEYVRSMLAASMEVLGPADAGHIARTAGRQIGMQYHDLVCEQMALEPSAAHPALSFAQLFVRLGRAQGDQCELEAASEAGEVRVRQRSWRFAAGLDLPAEGFEAWNGIFEGLASVHSQWPALRLTLIKRLDLGDECFEWRVH